MNTDQTSIYKTFACSLVIDVAANLASTILQNAAAQIIQAIGWC